MTPRSSSEELRTRAVEAMGQHINLMTRITCPECRGHGQPQGDGSGWDGTTYHTPACEHCGGEGSVPVPATCNNWRDSCHGDPDIDECVCARPLRDALAAAEPFIRELVVAQVVEALRTEFYREPIVYLRATGQRTHAAEWLEREFGGSR